MEQKIEIKPFEPRQVGRILEIEGECFGEDAYPVELFRELYADCGPLFIVAKVGRRIAGYMATDAADGQAELVSVAVDEAFRRSGVGRALLEHTLRALRKKRVKRWGLMVKSGNRAAEAFYTEFGFRRARRVRRYYEDGKDGWLMLYAAMEQ